MSNSIKRAILRWIHIIISIPMLGYIYGPPAEVQQYAGAVRYVFVPIILLSGFWMYGGLIFGLIGAAALLIAYRFGGYGAAVLAPLVVVIARQIWVAIRSRSRNPT